MDTYTESLENRARDINPEDDIDYSAALAEVVSMFRNFDEALDTFLVRHGYTGDRHGHGSSRSRFPCPEISENGTRNTKGSKRRPQSASASPSA